MRDYKTNSAAQLQNSDRAIAQFHKERELLWHQLAVQHAQRLQIITLLDAINRKLSALIDLAMRKGGLP